MDLTSPISKRPTLHQVSTALKVKLSSQRQRDELERRGDRTEVGGDIYLDIHAQEIEKNGMLIISTT